MPQEAYSYQVYIPTGVSAQARPPHEDPWVDSDVIDSIGDGTPWPTASAAQTSINVGAAAVVCLGGFGLVSLVRTTPVYRNIGIDEYRSSASDERFDLSALIAALETHADSKEPRECRGGVLLFGAGIQTHTDTPSAFVTDLEAACDWAASVAPAAETDAGRLRVRAALVWQTRLGTFHLEYEFHPLPIRSETSWDETVRFGFLLRDVVLDPTPYREFFETLDRPLPRYQAGWPHQELIVTDAAGEPPVTTLSVHTETDEGEDQRLPLHGSNPAYGVSWEDVSVSTRNGERVSQEFVRTPLWSMLRDIDSLRYAPGTFAGDYQEAKVGEIWAISSPSPNTLWVSADVSRVSR
jgi:hypothetical protein